MDKINSLYNEMLKAYISKDYKKAMSLSDEINKMKKPETRVDALRQQNRVKKSFAA